MYIVKLPAVNIDDKFTLYSSTNNVTVQQLTQT